MRIKQIKPAHITNCVYCKAEGNAVRAVWHLTGANKQSCDAHKSVLQELIRADKALNTDYSEADYQTWLRY